MSAGYPTPVYSHAGRGHFRDVYVPAEDSFLLIDALERDAERLRLIRSDGAHLAYLNASQVAFIVTRIS